MTHTNRSEQPQALPIRIHFTTNWGVATGEGSRGIVNSTVETDAKGYPLVRATVLTGIMREQAEVVARALDSGAEPDGSEGQWQTFVARLFGSRGRAAGGSGEDAAPSEGTTARLLSFSDAEIDKDRKAPDQNPTTEAVSISIDPETGSVKNDFFRTIERASANVLIGKVLFMETDHAGNPIEWTEEQQQAVRFVLSLAATLVRGIGSDRSSGDGECAVLVGEHSDEVQQRQWCKKKMEEYLSASPEEREKKWPPHLPEASQDLKAAPLIEAQRDATRDGRDTASAGFVEIPLTLKLCSPVVSYEVPMSNEVRTLDFLRGTTLLPWVHSRLRAAMPDSEIIRDAVVAGDLYVSDALFMAKTSGSSSCGEDTPVVGLPTPLCLSRSKAAGDDADHVLNRLRTAPAKNGEGIPETHVSLRGGFIFLRGPEDPISLGGPSTVGRQSNAHNAVTGATANAQLFLVRALAAEQDFGATVVMSARLQQELSSLDLSAVLSGEARLGTRKLSGTYGQVTCQAGTVREVPELPNYWSMPDSDCEEGPWEDDDTTTLWCASDLLVRSSSLGHGGSVEDIIRALRRVGVEVDRLEEPEADTPEDELFRVSIRHRRVDSWSGGGDGADGQPRPTRMAVQAGSVLRVKLAADADKAQVTEALAKIATTGLGDLRAQGYGRMLVGHPLLREQRIAVTQPPNEAPAGTEASADTEECPDSEAVEGSVEA
ncbi:RAMP superfamily CRISPR-associated protein [Schaalia sp. Marseille-Q2122]|uniref:RAMP superfamily CRISPR-associated protein n=1 Tax=Schaalia sp. Marseille-Q2122 TaxID=2736604 RepID=UPI00158D3147|nr:RAMP superfamily CRISPR-associated protein [Schaalia sp. Marseille-Q2122]